ncbi:MAG: DUF2252 family protein [Acidobacteriota bacterium]|nr:DUF2252 family protein [Acidobacteriota bacterium]
MNFTKATAKYEEWLGRHLHILVDDLSFKHEQMRTAPFPFLRATYYRWAQVWPEVCASAAKAPEALAVGDLHVENFGTWRDGEGRLIWGINDFDEVWRLPYTNDLVRLATSALLAGMNCHPREAAAAILAGYRESLEAGGRPVTLAEHHAALRHMASARLHEPEKFWEKLSACPEASEVPPAALKALSRMMPEKGIEWRLLRRRAGLGSLGRERYVALAEWRGGFIARETKALAPSAASWAAKYKGTARILYQDMLDEAVRCPDPFVRMQKRWIVRRLAPDCSRIELSALPKERDEIRLLHAMGWETANVHLSDARPKPILADLKKRRPNWLLDDARKMEQAVLADFSAQSAQ